MKALIRERAQNGMVRLERKRPTRTWLVAREDVKTVQLRDMVLLRLSAFGISYSTPGPQSGGEPLQIFLLQR